MAWSDPRQTPAASLHHGPAAPASPPTDTDCAGRIRRERAALIGLAICLALVLGGLFLVYPLKKSADLQDCVMQGRSNCAPVDGGN